MKKLWQKEGKPGDSADASIASRIEHFTVGRDRELDLELARFDVLGSMAHVRMLAETELLPRAESETLVQGLRGILKEIEAGKFKIEDGIEDVHSQVEWILTDRLGEIGKKIHMARSRNDQVLVDLRLFLRAEIEATVEAVGTFFDLLLDQGRRFQKDLMPGYTHLQLAMPSSFGLWFGAYAESLVDDLVTLQAAFEVVNQNPLGSAAGFGSSFPINRTLTTKLLGFQDLSYNVVYAQMGRGKSERIVAMALANLADTLSRLSMDACLFLNQNFDFVSFPAELTTGSSIMPHKKNPDVFELIRSRCNRMKALPNEILMMTTNLPSGYHRDLQILKEHLFPAFSELRSCIEMASLMLSKIEIKPDLLRDPKYRYLFSVEEVNRHVLAGATFRDAYRTVGGAIERGEFEVSTQDLRHTHEGSIGNPCFSEIKSKMDRVTARFQFETMRRALSGLRGE
ncbi:MAG: argininosuccinate lyase [Proteobacteria bacterium]|nr:argininosuccinate lyase [Pseudomonadota bacterium]